MSDDKEAGSWWKTLPGILTGVGSTIAAVAALVVALTQAGVLGPKKAVEPPPVVSPSVSSAATEQIPKPAPDESPSLPLKNSPGTDSPAAKRGLLNDLERAKVHNSVGDAVMQQWLDAPDGRYRSLAEVTLRVLGGKSLTAEGADLDKINYFYVLSIGLSGSADIPANHQIDQQRVQAALIKAYKDKNGTGARSLAEIVK
jgi:hypothetical protein